MENNFKNEMMLLTNMQIDLWNAIKNDLMATDNPTDKEVNAIFHKHLREDHHDVVLQLIMAKTKLDEVEWRELLGGQRCEYYKL